MDFNKCLNVFKRESGMEFSMELFRWFRYFYNQGYEQCQKDVEEEKEN